MDKPTFVYVTYIATTLEQLWSAIVSEQFTQQYWEGGQLQSDWQVGSSVQQIDKDGETESIGEVLESQPPYLLSYTLTSPNLTEAVPSRVRFKLEQYGARVKLTLIHTQLDLQSCMVMSRRWKKSVSYLKRLLEIEDVLALVA
ncbi:SRPBCC domain-containing protein [Chroococcidiopsis sp. FACHB-1243]|uniref:SRPBCC domain-containing protein n=1 Tax=Chroococcidiopsis sp. [FACHB-1243] TaxID=2692781 RepID=UPI00177A99F1|nr:SRPBCC domain-containing protein [Chroococcidiopsis sp. [FACHB-1243]]MBD2309112.1 SRPBCC domain-containing protein [Chroococcidiopsis sp. [FACHB-1243]]